MRSWVWLTLLAACAGASDVPTDTDADTDTTPACRAPGEVSTLATGFSPGSEGATVSPTGEGYVVSKAGLVRVDIDGNKTPLADFTGGVGAAWWRGAIWVAVWEDEAGDDVPGLLQITPSGEVTRHGTPGIDKPNFLTPTPWGTLLIADDFDTRIFEWTDGAITTWAEDVVSPNGMAFSPDASVLYVASTFDDPALSQIAVVNEAAGTLTKLTDFEGPTTPDGVAVGTDGSVLVALNLAQRIDVWRDGAAETLATDVPNVASLAYGLSGTDGCSVIATTLFGDTVQLVTTGVPGFTPDWLDPE